MKYIDFEYNAERSKKGEDCITAYSDDGAVQIYFFIRRSRVVFYCGDYIDEDKGTCTSEEYLKQAESQRKEAVSALKAYLGKA